MNPVVDSLSYSAIQPPEIIRRLVTLTNKLYIGHPEKQRR